MTFPPLIEVWQSLGPFPISGLVFMLVAAGICSLLLRRVFYAVRARLRQPQPDSAETRGMGILGVAAQMTLLIGVGHFYDSYTRLSNAVRWRIKPDQIAEIEVVRLPAMDKPPEGDPVYIRDQALLRDGFSRLADSRYYVNHHEIYLDGYRLRLRKVGEAVFSDRYLSVYRRSNDKPICPVVVLERGTGGQLAEQLAGEFIAPEFVKWATGLLDPRFPARPK